MYVCVCVCVCVCVQRCACPRFFLCWLQQPLIPLQLVKGADKARFLIDPIEKYSYLNQSGCYALADVDDAKMFEELNMVR
jgi:hypothetical protein